MKFATVDVDEGKTLVDAIAEEGNALPGTTLFRCYKAGNQLDEKRPISDLWFLWAGRQRARRAATERAADSVSDK